MSSQILSFQVVSNYGINELVFFFFFKDTSLNPQFFIFVAVYSSLEILVLGFVVVVVWLSVCFGQLFMNSLIKMKLSLYNPLGLA